jgi:LysM repeat protein
MVLVPDIPLTHVVQDGDTVWDIARAYKVQLADVVRWNNLPQPDLIRPGQVLLLWPPERIPDLPRLPDPPRLPDLPRLPDPIRLRLECPRCRQQWYHLAPLLTDQMVECPECREGMLLVRVDGDGAVEIKTVTRSRMPDSSDGALVRWNIDSTPGLTPTQIKMLYNDGAISFKTFQEMVKAIGQPWRPLFQTEGADQVPREEDKLPMLRYCMDHGIGDLCWQKAAKPTEPDRPLRSERAFE